MTDWAEHSFNENDAEQEMIERRRERAESLASSMDYQDLVGLVPKHKQAQIAQACKQYIEDLEKAAAEIIDQRLADGEDL